MIDIKIEYTHNGKKYKNFEDAFEQAVISGANEIVQGKLKSLASEISGENGVISVDIQGESMNVKYIGFSTELEGKITKALNQ